MKQSRRDFVRKIAVSGLAAVSCTRGIAAPVRTAFSGSGSGSPRPAETELIFSSAVKLARLIRSKAVSSEELVRTFLRRIETVNRRLNAVCQLDATGALKAARTADTNLARGKSLGPLHGIPITIKDSFDTAGIVSAAGTTGRRNFVPKTDATVVARLRTAGAIILGKTNTPELTLGYETDNLVYGKTNHPWDLERTPGGSSGGAAAIIAVGGSPFDIGSDTAGSIRVPASFCGIAGLKPTFGRVSRAGHILPPGGVIGCQVHVGPMARFVEDLALLLPILSGTDARDPEAVPAPQEYRELSALNELRIGFFASNGRSSSSPEIVQSLRSAVEVLTQAGMDCQEKCPPGFEAVDEILMLNIADGGDYYRRLFRNCGSTQLHPDNAAYLERARSAVISGRKYSDLLLDWERLKQDGLKFMGEVDCLISPAVSATAPEHGGTSAADFSYSYLFNLLGWPAAVVRAGTTADGLPVGIQIIGRPWKDGEVLAVASFLEEKLGGWKPDFSEEALI